LSSLKCDFFKIEEKSESRSPEVVVEQTKENEIKEKVADEPQAVEKADVAWSKHCIDLVRNVAHFVRSAFKD
jgi:hypothetical protein